MCKDKKRKEKCQAMGYKVYIGGEEYIVKTRKETARNERNAEILDAFKKARKDNPKVGVTVLCQLLAPKFDLSYQYFYRLIKKYGLQ